MHFFKQAFLILFLLWPLGSYGQEEPENIVVSQIIVKGSDRIEADAILTQIKTQKGISYTNDQLLESIRKDVRQLYQMGYFYNIEVDQTDRILTYTVTEKPFVTKITFDGNDALSDEDLQGALDIKPYEFLDVSSVKLAAEKMKKLYEEKGFFLAQLDYELKHLENNSAEITFHIQENDRVKVKDITILGNKNISDEQLTSAMLTRKKGFFSFLSGSGQYRQEFFERDVQILKVIYYNEGYINVEIDLPRVYISPDRKSISIRISVEEGERYKVGTVNVNNDELFSAQQLLDEISIKDNEFFAYNVLQSDLSKLQAMYGDLGYAYTNVVPQTQIDEKERKVNITFDIEKGEKVSFGKISIVGNQKTRDKVIRRELKIKEGELYNETDKRVSIANVRRLGYFEEVEFQQKTRPDQPHIMDIEIHVTERSTDSIQLQVGYNGRSGVMGTVSLQSYNLFGRGQSLAFRAATDTLNASRCTPSKWWLDCLDLFVNFTEPYFLDTLWSTGIEFYHQNFYIFEDGYREQRTGGSLRLGYPLAPYLRGFVNYKYYHAGIITEEEFDDTIPTYSNPESAEGSRSIVGLSLQYDRRDDRLYPRNGVYFSSSMEYAGIGGGKKYIEGSFNARFFKEIFWGIVFRNNLVYSFLAAPRGHEIPFNQLFRLGGSETLRGYDWYGVGKTERSTETDIEKVVGGTQQFYYNLEFQFPLVSRIKMLGVVFFDAGYADDMFELENFRSNVGFGFRLNTPISPIRIEFGIPIARRRNESGFMVQFSLGTLAPF